MKLKSSYQTKKNVGYVEILRVYVLTIVIRQINIDEYCVVDATFEYDI